eukprot:7352100-Prymnesium_polylepis.1
MTQLARTFRTPSIWEHLALQFPQNPRVAPPSCARATYTPAAPPPRTAWAGGPGARGLSQCILVFAHRYTKHIGHITEPVTDHTAP